MDKADAREELGKSPICALMFGLHMGHHAIVLRWVMVLKVRGLQVRKRHNIHQMAEADIKVAFGARVRALRMQREWSQERLSMIVGLDRSYVGSVERGERNLSLENIAKFAEALGVSLSDLMDLKLD